MAGSIGFLELGRSYAQYADFLSDAFRLKKVKPLRRQPVDFLYAHAFELMLKACLLECDHKQDIKSYGHNLLRLYDEVRSQELLGRLIHQVEGVVRERWKRYLRDARDNYGKSLNLGQLSTDERGEFGIHNNDVIGQNIPELRKQIIWLDLHHTADGGEFRYLRCGLDSREFINAFGLSEDVVWRSCFWALEEIYLRFRKHHIVSGVDSPT